ncbi:homing endonuclease associated repeat-containing protein [Lederbergia lenta]|uniref:homing endonuclease associated repeat-containing protein n=1 Tax=Lederbergia lenta TaxID=1467 RepID=UPI00203D25AB|nr:hypothetical protein [Lederbergia lenta]MCM3110046.1 hypothetical protein [Lederbergia lenta]
MAIVKYNEQYVSDFLNNLGCKLVSPYKNVKNKIKFVCHCGEVSEATFDSFKHGGLKGCKSCGAKRANNGTRLSYDYVKEYFDANGCVLLEDSYVNSKTKMRYICVCKRESLIDWNKFKSGRRCKKCAIEKTAEGQKLKYADVKNFFDKNNCKLLDTDYVDIHSPLKHICSCGEVAYKSMATFKVTPKCTCDNPYKSTCNLKNRYTKDDLIEYFWEYYEEFSMYPRSSDLKNNKSYPSPSTYERFWGSYRNFMIDIGVLSETGWYVDDEDVLRENYRFNDIPKINSLLIEKRSESTIRHKANQLGLQVNYDLRFGREYLSNEDIIKSIRRFVSEIGYVPSMNDFCDYQTNIKPSLIRVRFGSWNKALTSSGIEPVNKIRELSKRDIADMIKMYNEGTSNIEIASIFGFEHPSSIIYHLQKAGVKLKTNRWSKENIAYLKENYSTKPLDELVNDLERFTLEDIFTKASRIGLKRDNLNGARITNRYTASDGTICLSQSEYKITELLIKNKINFSKELFYKDILDSELMGKLRCDWYINGIVVEYFGMRGSEKYDKNTKRKKLACQKKQIPMISLYHYDLLSNFKGLISKFSKEGIFIKSHDDNS